MEKTEIAEAAYEGWIPALLVNEEDIWIEPEWVRRNVDGIPADAYLKRTLVWTLRPDHDAAALEAALGDPSSPLRQALERIRQEHEVVWDGSTYRGRLTSEGKEIQKEVESLLEAEEFLLRGDRWEAYEWATVEGTVPAATVLEELGLSPRATEEEVAEALRAAAEDEDVILLYVEEGASRLLEEAREK